ncbi:elongation factor P [bacterium (Candidatus Howlettbacteria) CG_4_10_14_0_8_um_filter_40_9]|nr:MAG: elongation factor P [bacterium (Candidatus Howlettbacteria) CG_4_10_14_0_8_um_filter_40_9]
MFSIADLKIGRTFLLEGDIYVVLYTEHSKQARGGAILRTKLKNLLTRATIDRTFKGSEKFEEARIEKKKCQYLYKEGSDFNFMNSESYEQFALSTETVGNLVKYIKEGDTVDIQYFKEKPISLSLPIKVKLKVAKAEKGFKGNTASSVTKPVTLESGYVLYTPLFIKEGDTVLVNTETGEYVERV